jgi:hypothetical protein
MEYLEPAYRAVELEAFGGGYGYGFRPPDDGPLARTGINASARNLAVSNAVTLGNGL